MTDRHEVRMDPTPMARGPHQGAVMTHIEWTRSSGAESSTSPLGRNAVEVLPLPPVLAERLRRWKGRPDLLGGWLDLLLHDQPGRTWTLLELCERWEKEWSPKKSRFWVVWAEELELVTRDGERGWRLVRHDDRPGWAPPPVSVKAGGETKLGRKDPASGPLASRSAAAPPGRADGPPDPPYDCLALDIAQSIVEQIPAMRDLRRLERRASRARMAAEIEIDFDFDTLPPVEQLERSYVLHVLDRVGGKKTEAAEVLGVAPSTLHRKLQRWGVARGGGPPAHRGGGRDDLAALEHGGRSG